MSGDKKERDITKTDSEAKREKAKKVRKKTKEQKSRMFISISGDNIQPREIFAKKLIPFSGYLRDIVVSIPDVPMPVKLHVVTEFGPHSRRDTFSFGPGLTTLEKEVQIREGAILKFSAEFESDHLEEIYISGSLISK